jgi:hypothetical protein
VTYVRPILEYCSTVWSPHYKYLCNKIESVQRYFTKRIPGLWHISYSVRLKSLGLMSLEARRSANDLVLLYKILNNDIDSSLLNSFVIAERRTRGHDLRIVTCRFSKDIMKYHFVNRVIKLWNGLPSDVVHAPTVASFRKRLLKLDTNIFLTHLI